ncbi:hypothetical protein RUND412_003166 [Rhizina undulata]
MTFTSCSQALKLTRRILYGLGGAYSVWNRTRISYDEKSLRDLAAELPQTDTVAVTNTASMANPPAVVPLPPLAMNVTENQAVLANAPPNHVHGQSPNSPPPTDTLPGESVTPEPVPIVLAPVQEQEAGARATPPPVPPNEVDISAGWEDLPDVGDVSRRPRRTGGRTRGRGRGRQPGV